jgi:four helix bundle protein
MARDPQKLEVYHHAHQLALAVCRLTAKLPAEERFGLQSQLRRAVVSIPANLVEGAVRRHSTEYVRFLDIAMGSAIEVRYLLDLMRDLGLAAGSEVDECRDLSDRVFRELHNLQRAVTAFRS